MLDLMPAPHLIFSEWDRHGTCSGLSPRAYFETVRKARAVVKIPPEYMDLQEPLSVAPAAVEDAFIKANPGLSQGDIADATGLSLPTIKRAESDREVSISDEAIALIRKALESAGVEFTNGGRPGVRLRKKRKASAQGDIPGS